MDSYGLALVGTGFASSFFLREYLRHAPATERVLVVERGSKIDLTTRLTTKKSSNLRFDDLIVNRTPQKGWLQNIAFGGGTCWTGNVPRFHPNDFRTKTLYGRGVDWPITYEDLEPFYVQAEEEMGVAGATEGPYPRSKPYPCPPHRYNAMDRLLARKYPNAHIHLPSARSSDPKRTKRAQCCASGVCSTCPVSSKFQIDLHMNDLYADPRVTLLLESEVERLEIAGNTVVGVHYRSGGKEQFARCELAGVGAHAIMTPYLLLRSGLTDRALGRYLNEQIGVLVTVELDGVENFDGGQAVTGLNLAFLDGPFRRQRAGCLVENWNLPWLRAEPGRWRHRAFWKFVFEDEAAFENSVTLSDQPGKPAVHYPKHSPYMAAGLASVKKMVEELAREIPVESYAIHDLEGLGGSAHIQGTHRMGNDPNDSVVDKHLRHHRVRNLLALGGGAFPTCPAGNPTLSLCALSMWAARHLFS
jgi:choline dehydrogenase-like flavoprotein